jgi:hypothetical protein
MGHEQQHALPHISAEIQTAMASSPEGLHLHASGQFV